MSAVDITQRAGGAAGPGRRAAEGVPAALSPSRLLHGG